MIARCYRYRVRLRTGSEALCYVLVEHKSWHDRGVVLQLLGYLVDIWKDIDRKAERRGRLPPIIPLLVYHGVPAWDTPLRFLDLVEADTALRLHLLDFPLSLVDLGRIAGRLSDHALLRLGLLVLRHVLLGTDPRLLLEDEGVAALRTDRDFLVTLLHYLVRVQGPLDRPVILDLVARVLPGEEDAVVSKFAEELLTEGKHLGWIEGRAEGVAEGKTELLLRLLHRRFGPVPASWQQVVRSAEAEQIEAWGEAIFDAPSLEALLGTPKPH